MSGILDVLAAAERDGAPAYVHCWGGIGRTGTVVGCHQRERGYSAERALERVEELRHGSSKVASRIARDWMRSAPSCANGRKLARRAPTTLLRASHDQRCERSRWSGERG